KLNDSGKIYFIDVTQEKVKLWRERVIKLNEWWYELLKEAKKSEKGGKEDEKKTKGEKTPKDVKSSTPSTDKKTPAKKKATKKESEIKIPVSGNLQTDCSEYKTCSYLSFNYDELGHKIYNIKKCLESDDQEDFEIVGKQKSVSIRRINYIYFSDIIDSAIEAIVEDNPKAKNFITRSSVLLGNMMIRDFVTKEKSILHSVNIGDLPVSLHDYTTWFQKKVSNSEATVWTLRDFIQDAASDLIFAALGEGCPSKIKQPSRPSYVQMDSIGFRASKATKCGRRIRDPIPRLPRICLDEKRMKAAKKGGKQRIIWDGGYARRMMSNDAGKSKVPGLAAKPITPYLDGGEDCSGKNIFSYLYFYGMPSDKIGDWANRIRSEDEARGVFHFDLSSASGILKTISFKKTAIKSLREKRIVESTEGQGIGNQLLDQYDASLTLYGTTFFKPGMFIYINPNLPNSFGQSNLVQARQVLGLGGYYVVTQVDHEITASKNETKLEAIWQNYSGSGHGKKKGSKKSTAFHSCKCHPLANWFIMGPCTKEKGPASDVPMVANNKKRAK
ncbi:hypothetical protein OAT10_04285, partial [Luminiphilus sp.]|nr:hypothetical protein [Luminiphilus sp.]